MNLAEHLNRFYQDLKSPDTVRYPLALVKDWLDEAERVVNKNSKTIRASSVVDSVSDQRLYAFPSDILDWQIREIYYSTTDSTKRKRLVPSSTKELDSINSNWRNINGVPKFWYLDKEQAKWGLSPFEESVDTGTECIEILYRSKHTKMTRYYIIGTVTINNGETAVSGSGTAFIGNVYASDELGIGKLLNNSIAFPVVWHPIASDAVADDALILSAAFSEASVSGASYVIASPSSITNDELNLCSVLWAMSLAKGKDGNYDGRDALQRECVRRVLHEVAMLKNDAARKQPMIPAGAHPYPGPSIPEYDFRR